MSGLLDGLLTANAVWVYGLVGALVFAEDALFFGFVIPGETAAVLGGVDASRGNVSLLVMVVVVVAAAIVGDSVGYEVGRLAGPRILASRLLSKHADRLSDAQSFLRRRGGAAVFFGRFVAFFRAVMPALAGSARMPYARFLVFNAAGGITWGVGFVLLGYLAGDSYKAVENTVGRGTAIALVLIVFVVVVGWRRRRRAAAQEVAAAAARPAWRPE